MTGADGEARQAIDVLAGELERHGAVLTDVDIDGDTTGVDFTIRGRLQRSRVEPSFEHDVIPGMVEQLERMKVGEGAGDVSLIDDRIRSLKKLQEALGDGGDA